MDAGMLMVDLRHRRDAHRLRHWGLQGRHELQVAALRRVEQLLANFKGNYIRDQRRHGVAEHPLNFGLASVHAQVFGEPTKRALEPWARHCGHVAET